MSAQTQTATRVQWQPPKNGANLAAVMASYYPVDEDLDGERIRTSIRLDPEQHADIEFIAQLWNELDAALGKKKARKWKPASVLERLVAVGIDGFWHQIGGRPPTREGRAEFIRQAVKRLREERDKK